MPLRTTCECLTQIVSLDQVADVRDVMMKNIDKVLERGEKLDTLVDKADNLRFQARRRVTEELSRPTGQAAAR